MKKSNIRGFLAVLASREILLWFGGAWILFYVVAAIWMNEAFAYFMNGIANNVLIRIPFILFLICSVLNIIRVSKDMLKKGFLNLLIWVVLPSGIIIFLAGFFLSINMRKTELHLAGEGDIIKHGLSPDILNVLRMDSGLQERIWDFELRKGIFASEPKMSVKDASSRSFVVKAYPPEKINNIYYHILNFGIAPGIVLYEGVEKKKEGYMPLRILIPGTSDEFMVHPYPYRFVISMLPARTVQKQRMKSNMFNLMNPEYSVKVYRDGKIIAEGDSAEKIRFEGLALGFSEPSYWAMVEIVKDPALPILLAGILISFAGLPLYLIRFLLMIYGPKVLKWKGNA